MTIINSKPLMLALLAVSVLGVSTLCAWDARKSDETGYTKAQLRAMPPKLAEAYLAMMEGR